MSFGVPKKLRKSFFRESKISGLRFDEMTKHNANLSSKTLELQKLLPFSSSNNFATTTLLVWTPQNSSTTTTTTIVTDHSSREPHKVTSSGEAAISIEEWRGWGTTSTVPTMVTQVVDDLNLLEKDIDSHMVFGGNHGKLSGDFKMQEDKKHREKYKSLGDSQQKLQFFSAHQIACRVL